MEKEFLIAGEIPENLGIPSQSIINMLDDFDKNGLYMHSFMLLRRGKIAAEGYYKPFCPDTPHRMYSISKTFTATAIGLLCDEGKISLDDKVYKYFPDKCPPDLHPYIKAAAIRDLLMMATPFSATTYASLKYNDWAWTFFNTKPDHPPGTVFNYDTSGSYILNVIAERVSGMPFLEYLKEKMLRYIGFSENARCIKAPEGNSWGGSGVICTTRDLAKFALVYLNKGNINGKQLISREFVNAATARQIDNNVWGHEKRLAFGYGYQIWLTRDNTFSFMGMGNQLAICIPEKDMLFVCTADNQGNETAEKTIYDCLWNNIIEKAKNEPLPENSAAYNLLLERISKLSLYMFPGEKHSETEREIDGVPYKMNENPMGISELRLEFLKDYGKLSYNTPRGEKEILFGYGEYKEGVFPETHYSGDTIGTPANRPYRCVAAGVWTQQHKLVIKVNIIDDYFGNLTINLGFKGQEVGMVMHKTAEWFLNEYQGFAGGEMMNT